jgi:hypothetical protein
MLPVCDTLLQHMYNTFVRAPRDVDVWLLPPVTYPSQSTPDCTREPTP